MSWCAASMRSRPLPPLCGAGCAKSRGRGRCVSRSPADRVVFALDRAAVRHEPRGLVLILGTWNYPVLLVIDPLVGALAAGNVAMVHVAEAAAATGRLIAETLPRYLDVVVLRGGRETAIAAQNVPGLRFVFATGSSALGRAVGECAARRLVPVTLELGGQSPCVVTSNAALQAAASRIAWGKLFNAGQSCVAPDHVIVVGDDQLRNDFVLHLTSELARQYVGAERCTRIVSRHHGDRLHGYLAQVPHEWIAHGGNYDHARRVLEPTVVVVPCGDARANGLAMLDEEIFGPLLPVLHAPTHDAAISALRARPWAPLALYVFSQDAEEAERYLRAIPSGGACINDVLLQFAHPHLPFGGLGQSGVGSYHGFASFRTFSHQRSVLWRTTIDEPLHRRLRYAPLALQNLELLRDLLLGAWLRLVAWMFRGRAPSPPPATATAPSPACASAEGEPLAPS